MEKVKKTRQRSAEDYLKYTGHLTVRISHIDLTKLKSYAEQNGMTKGEVVRKALMKLWER